MPQRASPTSASRRDRSKTPVEVWLVEGDDGQLVPDELATEEPLEIRLATTAGTRPVAVTLRTPGGAGGGPGSDVELAAGFLFAEGVIREPQDVTGIDELPPPPGSAGLGGAVTVRLRPGLEPDLAPLERHFTVTSACGACGKTSLDALLAAPATALPPGPVVPPAVLHGLPASLHRAQGVFHGTGGLHAAGLFTPGGELVDLREDVGRHNALDKLVGRAFLEGRLPLHDHLVLVSGRASFELVQKSAAAGVPILAAVSAPSSLAVATARRAGMTLVGFLWDGRFNVYGGRERIAGV